MEKQKQNVGSPKFLLTYQPEKHKNFFWKSWQKLTAWITLCVVLCVSLVLIRVQNMQSVTPLHGFNYLGVRPGLTMSRNLLGEIVFEEDGVLSERSVFDIVPENATDEEIILLALKLYAIGNLSMVTAPCSAIYSEGTSDSMIIGAALPLYLEAIEVRNNISGEYFKLKNQIIKPGVDIDMLVLLMGNLAKFAERRYYKAGLEQALYQRTATINQDESGRLVADWTTLTAVPEDRLAIMTRPVPYTAAGVRAADASAFSVASGLFYEKAPDSDDIYIPYYINSADVKAGYEKSDQHFSYDLDDEFLQTVKSASVSYNAEGGYYVVTMSTDPLNKYYTTMETRWSLTDSSATGDPNADYTKIDVRFELWDNGYFKKWEMWENWLATNARQGGVPMGKMSAVQYYLEEFTYNAEDCDLEKYRFW